MKLIGSTFLLVLLLVKPLAWADAHGNGKAAKAGALGAQWPIGRHAIQAKMNGKCLNVPQARFMAGTTLQMWDCEAGNPGQTFEFTPEHQIRADGLCLNAYGGAGRAGDSIGLWQCVGAANEKWDLVNGRLIGINGRCINISGANTNSGAAVILWDCVDGAPNEVWSVTIARRLPAANSQTPASVLAPSGTAFKDCPLCPEMVVIPPGSFTMGSPESEVGRWDHEGPQHPVRLGQALAVGKFEVTFREWDACVADGGCDGWQPADNGWGRDTRPVIHVSWGDTYLYTRWLSKKTGRQYRLLSESEREYAARAGSETRYYWGNEVDAAYAKFETGSTLPVGSTRPNALGLYDMSGNVDEWTDDCYHPSYDGAPRNGMAWTTGNCSTRVTRGGAYFNFTPFLRSASRYGNPAGLRSAAIGFRVATNGTPLVDTSGGETEYSMAQIYDRGDGVPKDRALAVRWYRLAAEAGHLRAQIGLGWDYMNGQGVHQSYAESAKFFRMAANKGDADAQGKLGSFYEYGDGVPKDMAESVKWYRLAATQGNANAASSLGRILANGKGVAANPAEATKWLQVAANTGNADAKRELEKLSTDLEGDLQAAKAALARNDLVGAINHATRVINSASSEQTAMRVSALSIRGNAFYQNRRYELAVPDLEAAIRLDPNATAARSTLASVRSDTAHVERLRRQEREREQELQANRNAGYGAASGSPSGKAWDQPDYMKRAEQARKSQNTTNCERAAKGGNVYCQRN